MTVTRDPKADAFFTAFNAAYQKGKADVQNDFDQVATTVPSSDESETYSWLGAWPELQKWVGDRQFQDLTISAYQIANEHYEVTVPINKNKIDDDKVGVYLPMAQEMGKKSVTFPNKFVFGLLKNGFTEKCYDGQPFFSATHQVGSKTVSNADIPASNPQTPWFLLDTSHVLKPLIFQLRKKPTNITMQYELSKSNQLLFSFDTRFNVGYGFWQMAYASQQELNADNLTKALTAMRSQTNELGEPLDIKPTLLVVPPSLRATAKQLLKAELIMGSSNPLYGEADFLSTAYVQ